MQWGDLQALAAIVSSICAIVAATVSVLIWRKSRSTDLSERIDNGDRAIRKHADKSIGEIKTQLDAIGERVGDMEDGVARIEASAQHHLTARDLGLVHEKINRVAESIASNTATTNAMREQLRVIQEHLMRRDRQ